MEKIKINVSFRPYPTCNRKLQKNSNKISFRFVSTRRVIENSKKIVKKFKKLKNTFMASFQAKIGWKRLRKGENKN